MGSQGRKCLALPGMEGVPGGNGITKEERFQPGGVKKNHEKNCEEKSLHEKSVVVKAESLKKY